MKTLKLVIVFPFDPLGPKVGGAGTFIKGVMKYAPDYFDIDYIGVSCDAKLRPAGQWLNSKLGQKSFNFYPLFIENDENRRRLIPLSLRFTLALRNFKYAYKNKIVFFNRIEPTVLFKKYCVPKIVVIHYDVEKQILSSKSELFWSKIPKVYFALEKYVFRYLNHVFSVNTNALKYYQNRYPEIRNKFSFLPNCVDTDFFLPSAQNKLLIRKNIIPKVSGLSISKKWILFVGRLQETKAPMRLIQSFYEYYQLDSDSCLLILGQGNLYSKVKQRVRKLGMEYSVFFLGAKSQNDLCHYYQASDVMLLTSNFEGSMPISTLEALGCGLPVVSTDVGEVKRVVKNSYSGEVVKSFEPKDIVDGLKKVLHNPLTYKKEHCVQCIENFKPEKVLRPVYELIERMNMEEKGSINV